MGKNVADAAKGLLGQDPAHSRLETKSHVVRKWHSCPCTEDKWQDRTGQHAEECLSFSVVCSHCPGKTLAIRVFSSLWLPAPPPPHRFSFWLDSHFYSVPLSVCCVNTRTPSGSTDWPGSAVKNKPKLAHVTHIRRAAPSPPPPFTSCDRSKRAAGQSCWTPHMRDDTQLKSTNGPIIPSAPEWSQRWNSCSAGK